MVSAASATASIDSAIDDGSRLSATICSNRSNGSVTTRTDDKTRTARARPAMAPHPSTAAATTGAHAHDSKSAPLLAMLWPCALYLCCAFAMNMLTKIVLTTYGWKALYTLGAVQNTFTMASVSALVGVQRLWQRYSGQTSSRSSKHTAPATPRQSHSLPAVSYVLKVVLPLVTLHVGNMILGFASMRVVNMPMYLVLRRLTTLKVMLIEWLVLRKETSVGVKLALLLSAVGSVVAGSTDVTADAAGYTLVLLQNLCSALSLTFSKESALSSIELVLLNSVAGSAICSVLAFHLERDAVLASPSLHDAQFLAVVGVMCCVCVLYQFSIFICTLRNSALATSVTGNVKDLVSTVCGFVLFSDAPVRANNLVGVALSFLGAYSFSYLKYLAFRAQGASARAVAGGGSGLAKPKQA